MLLKPLLIYLADDDQDDRMLFKEALDEIDTGIAIEDFDNGVTLMDNLLNRNKRLPDIIYLDLNMPLMNGEECLYDIRNEPELVHIPIVIYSTYVDEASANLLREKGANLFLEKPDTFNKLKNLVRKSLESITIASKNILMDTEFVLTEKRYSS